MQNSCFIWRHVTQKTVHYMSWRIVLLGISIRNISKPTWNLYQKSWPWPSTYVLFLSHALDELESPCEVHNNPSSINEWYAAVNVLKNALCFIMGYLVAMEIRVTLFCFICCIMHSIGPINVCTDVEISRYKIDEFKKKSNIYFIWRHVVFRSGTFWNQPEVSTTCGSKVMAQTVVFMFLVTLTFDICSMFCHTHWAGCTGISMWTYTYTHTHARTEGNSNSLANAVGARLTTYLSIQRSSLTSMTKYCTQWPCIQYFECVDS